MMCRIRFLFVGILVFALFVSAKVSRGSVHGKDFMFLDKFGVDRSWPWGGAEYISHVHFTIQQHGSQEHKLLVYDNGQRDFYSVYHNKKLSCQDKVSFADWKCDLPCPVDHLGINNTGPAKFVYVMVSACESKVDVSYYLKFLNPGGYWDRQFSYDRQSLLAFFILLFFVVTGLGALQWYANMLHGKEVSRLPVVKFLNAATILFFSYVLLSVIDLAIYAQNGVGLPPAADMAVLCEVVVSVLIMFICITLSTGWLVVSLRLRDKQRLLMLFVALTAAYVLLFFWDVLWRDRASSNFLYDSLPGVIIVLLRLGVLSWFGLNIYRLYFGGNSLHPEQKQLYKLLTPVLGFWLVWLPLVALLGLFMNPIYRQKVVVAVSLIINTVTLGFLIWLLWPSGSNRYNLTGPPVLSAGGAGYSAIDEYNAIDDEGL